MVKHDSLNDKTVYPLTSFQKDIWLDQKMNLNNPSSNIGAYVEVTGEFDYVKLNEAINCIISKNDALRIQIREKHDEPYQFFLSEINYSLPYYDFSNIEMTQSDIREWIQKRFEVAFDLNGLLFNFALIKSNNDLHYFFIKSHHIITDGWALTQLIHKVVDAYNDFSNICKGSSFITLIDKDQNYLLSNMYQKDIDFWKEEFKTIPEPIYSYKSNNISTDITSKRYKHVIPRLKYNKIISYCADNNITEFHYFLAIFSIYFCRLFNRKEIVIGVPMLNRSRKEMNVIGHCANSIPLKIIVDKNTTFINLVKEIKLNFSKCYRHHKLSYGRIYREINQIKRALCDICVSFDMHNTQFNFNSTDTVTEVLSHQHESKALFALIHAADAEGDAKLYLDYLLEIFNDKFPIERAVSHLDVIIDQTLEDGYVKVKDVDILSSDEKNLLLNVFNNTKTDFPVDKTIIQLFEEQVVNTPNNIAVVFEDVKLTYKELNEKANIVGHYLKTNYMISPDDLIAVMLNRSENIVIALLGVLKSGAAYVPIDSKYPQDRIRYMLEDSKPKVTITDRAIQSEDFKESINIKDILGSEQSIENPVHVTKTKDLAYVIYTSGSTGKPKGTLLENSGLINMSLDQIRTFDLTEKDNVLQFASTSFDASMYEIFMALFSGCTLVITSEEVKNNISSFHNELIDKEVTVATLPPAFLKNLNKEIIRKLRVLITAGEKPIISDVKELNGYLKYINAFGPTEASVCVSTYYVDPSLSISDNTSIPIGKPISNTKLYILDQNSKPMPIGIGGELCISGVGLARGYLNRPKLTAEKFVDNPFIPGERMYKTGDLVRFLPDGNIEFLGRIDNQVKIRGFRVELDEIENSLIQHDEINNTVVVVKEKDNGDKILVAYYISERELNISELRSFLGKSLPNYMIPSNFIQMDAFPATTNGKIDKKALPELGETMNTGVKYIAPQNEIQEKLVVELQDVLGLKKVGILDNFFEIGADSLDLLRFVQRIQSQFEIEFSDVIQYPTIFGISKIVKPKNKESIVKKIIDIKENMHNREVKYVNNENELNSYRKRFNREYANIDVTKTMEYSTILLTGATGYLGIHVLKELLLKGKADIFLVIRGISNSHAKERLSEKYMYYFNEDINLFKKRIHVLNGDLTKNNLGLLEDEYDEVASKVQCIINTAADVSHYGSYESFYNSNVVSVENLLNLCEQGYKKYFVHISTTGVGTGNGGNKDNTLFTEYNDVIDLNNKNVYVRSKLEAEKRVFDAREKGINSTILRVGNLVFQSSTGKYQENIDSNAFYQILKCFIELKMMPNILSKDIELSYIDLVSQAVVLLFDKVEFCNEVFHLYNHNTINYPEFADLLKRNGYDIPLYNLNNLYDNLIELYNDPKYKEIIEILLIHSHSLESSKENNFTFTSEKTIHVLKKLGFQWDKVEMKHIEKMVEFGIKSGFFNKQLIEVH